MKLALVGTGIMGRHMAANLLKAGTALTVHSRTRQKADELTAQGAHRADSPGAAAKDADCVITMVGGEAADFERTKPVLASMGSTLVRFGAAGSGQRAKLVNQVVAMQNVIGAIEGLFLARKAGLDTSLVLQVLQNGMADSKSLRNSATRALQGDFSPNFHPAHVVKDLQLALGEAEALGMDLPGLRNARERWQELLRRFPEARAVQEVARLYP